MRYKVALVWLAALLLIGCQSEPEEPGKEAAGEVQEASPASTAVDEATAVDEPAKTETDDEGVDRFAGLEAELD